MLPMAWIFASASYLGAVAYVHIHRRLWTVKED